ncbi:MAG: hypothetical protein P4L74_06690 [Candidatus Doudnabacteria bacterium]|nr:hypothetical protein [Candidatus Doudnabacteria bacterium]
MKQKLIALASCLVIGISALAGTAFAATPSLTVTQTSTGFATLNVSHGDPNAQINLYERQSNSYWISAATPGSTDTNGNYTGTISITPDGSSNALQFYVTVNGQISAISQIIPSGSGSGLTFSSTNPVLSTGQTIAVSISSANNSSASYYLSNNSNSGVVNASISGSVITLSGQGQGTATLSVCQNSSNICSSLVVTVNSNGTNSSGTLTFSPTALTSLVTGQNSAVAVSGSTGTIYISSNSNPTDITTGINGTTVTVYALGAGTGTLNICDQGTSHCGTLYVAISGSGNTQSSTGLTLGSTNPVLNIGQSQNISIFATSGSNSFSVSGNTNPTSVSASINGSQLVLVGLSAGTSTVTVCQTGTTFCATTFVTVNITGGGGLTFSQTTVNLNPGQSATVVINSGSGSYTLSGNTNPTAAPATVSGSNLYVSGNANGSASVTICQIGNSSLCGSVTVQVGSSSGSLTFSNPNPSLVSGQSQTITIFPPSSYGGAFTISNNTNSAAAGVILNGTLLTLTGGGTGNTVITICETGTTVCGTVTATTTNASTSSTSVYINNTNITSPTLNQSYSYQLQASGGNGGYSFSISNGSLPTGLAMTSTGLITGTPTSALASPFTLKVTDSAGGTSTINLTMSSVSITPVVTTPTTPSGLSVPASTTTTTTIPAAGASSATYHSGELISHDGTIYMVYQNTETGFANAPAFLGLGFNFDNVVPATNVTLGPSGKTVVTAQGAHPRGTWIQSKGTVYFLTPTGLIPVPSWDIFTNNGGQASYIVPATTYDMTFPILPLMTNSDSRVTG